jgi:hypothetical protein
MMNSIETTRSALALTKLEALVNAGKDRATQGLAALSHEWGIRHDMMVKPTSIDVEWKTDEDSKIISPMQIVIENGHRASHALTPHARGQLLSMADVPSRFADTLVENGMPDLLRENVRRLLAKTAPDGLLVREVGGTVKGVLSPSYRRMDSSPLFESFVEQATASGLVPHDGMVTDTRAFLSFLRPEVTELLPGEHVVFAVELKGSDYGNGAVDLALSIWRLLCTNGMIGTSLFRKVHLGRRFDGFGDGNVVQLSDATVNLDTKTIASGMRDIMKALPAQIEGMTSAIREQATGEVNLSTALSKLSKAGLRKATVEKVKALYETEQPVESLPEMPGKWRLSNVLSLIANGTKDGDEAHDLRELAASPFTLA